MKINDLHSLTLSSHLPILRTIPIKQLITHYMVISSCDPQTPSSPACQHSDHYSNCTPAHTISTCRHKTNSTPPSSPTQPLTNLRQEDWDLEMTGQESMGVRAAKAVPAIAIGVVTGALLMRNAEGAMKMLERGCPDRAAYSWRSNVAVLDKVLCLLVNFFVYGVRSDEGKVVTGYIGTLLVSVMAFMAVEGSRLKSGLALSATWLHGIVLQITGVSVSFPALWLPVYFLYDGGNREHGHIWRKKISLFRVAAIAVAFLFMWLNLIALFFPLNTDKKQAACLLFLAMPFAVTVAYLPFQTSQDAPQQKGHKGVIALHLLQAGFGLTWHLVAILFVLRDHEIPGRVVHLFTSFRTEEWPVYFLLVDCVSLFLSFLYLTAVEDGAFIALLELVGGVLFGPAFAVSAYCVYREQCISKAVSRVRNKTKEN